jgi:MSHA biogenesis protein MshN
MPRAEVKIAPEDGSAPAEEKHREPRGKLVKQVSPAEQSEYHYQRGAAFLQQGRLAEAESELRSALRFRSDQAAARQVLAGLLIEQKRYKEAEQALQAGLQLDPGQVGFSVTLARLQVESGDNQSALDTLKSALPHAGDDADFYGFYAALLQRAGQHADAVDYFSMALKKVPSAGKWWVGMGISLKEENKMREAENAFNHALSAQDLNPELRAYAQQQIRAMTKADRP